MLLPCLPNDDPSLESRASQLAESREAYRYSYTWPPEVAVAAEVPKRDDYSTEYVARVFGITAEIFRNLLPVADLFVSPDKVHEFLANRLERLREQGLHGLRGRFFEVQTDVARHMTAESPTSLSQFGRFFNSIEAPPAAHRWDDDRSFAWQRIAGVNPMVLRRVDAKLDDVAIGEAEYARAIGGGSLAGALAEGRLFACDYRLLAGAEAGSTNGRKKWLPAPVALFVAIEGALRPVAIQTGPSPDSPVYTPGDGHAWQIARLAVQTADANHHETISHLGRTHLVMEAVALAMHRQLAKGHPLSVLLTPHIEFTLPINQSAATSLIAAGGAVDLLFAGTIATSAGFVKKGLDSFSLPSSSIPSDMAARGLDDTLVLPEHPYRDDGLLVWAAIQRFVDRYVRTYYASDAMVAQDAELAAWVREMGSADGGRLKGMRPVETVDALVSLVAVIVWTGSAQHSAVNFPQFPYMSAPPNMPGAFWSDWPVAGATSDEATLVSVLPPFNMAALGLSTVYQLSSVRLNRLGHYPLMHFHDRAARALVDGFNADLKSAEQVIAEREKSRFMPYPFLLPSTIPASIHI